MKRVSEKFVFGMCCVLLFCFGSCAKDNLHEGRSRIMKGEEVKLVTDSKLNGSEGLEQKKTSVGEEQTQNKRKESAIYLERKIELQSKFCERRSPGDCQKARALVEELYDFWIRIDEHEFLKEYDYLSRALADLSNEQSLLELQLHLLYRLKMDLKRRVHEIAFRYIEGKIEKAKAKSEGAALLDEVNRVRKRMMSEEANTNHTKLMDFQKLIGDCRFLIEEEYCSQISMEVLSRLRTHDLNVPASERFEREDCSFNTLIVD